MVWDFWNLTGYKWGKNGLKKATYFCMSMLRVVDLTAPAPQVENPYPFPLDTFQTFAFDAINKKENVLVTAKTGSGKTLVGEYQIKVSREKGKRVFYTTPIKSLTNQKFHDLKEMGYSVGIMTGDIKFCPDADIVVMTTEILCNLLFARAQWAKGIKPVQSEWLASLSLNNVDAIVFDEVHYINNIERGKVWEQCLMLLEPSISLVLLSATISEPQALAKWLGDLKQVPIHLISTQYRVIPLKHTVGNEMIMDAKDRFYPDAYNRWLLSLEKIKKGVADHKEAVRDRRRAGYEATTLAKKDRKYSFVHQLNQTVNSLDEKGLLPALVFVLSRKKCCEYAAAVESSLITSSDVASIRHIVKFHLHRFPELETSTQYHELMGRLEKGVAFHHSGLLPILKEIVEILFGRGFIKLLFATETFAVGINMPTKTVIFTSFMKHDGQGMRMLRPDEYTQMAGRAGRRGKDTEGLVIYLPDRDPSPLGDVQRMMTGGQQKVSSRLDFGYEFVLRTYYGKDMEWKDLVKTSFWYQQHLGNVASYQADYDAELAKRSVYSIDDAMGEALAERRSIEDTIAVSVNATKRAAQKKLDEWKQAHPEPEWERAWKNQAAYAVHTRTLNNLSVHMECLARYEESVERTVGFLRANGYLSTQLGLYACSIREGHPLLMSWAFHTKLFHNLDIPQLMACLSLFMGGDEKDAPLTLNDSTFISDKSVSAIKELTVYAKKLEAEEPSYSNWELDFYWLDVVIRWVSQENAYQICRDYGVYEGNFIRAMLKLSNLAIEWCTMAEQAEDIQMLDKLRDIQPLIVRGIVVPDSLYLRM